MNRTRIPYQSARTAQPGPVLTALLSPTNVQYLDLRYKIQDTPDRHKHTKARKSSNFKDALTSRSLKELIDE